jgi:hypothetical protein
MKTRLLALWAIVAISMASSVAQTPQSFFPRHIGDRWDYVETNSPQVLTMTLSRDSVGADSSHNLFYNNFSSYPLYRMDTSQNVFWIPQDVFLNYQRYKLAADSGEAWTIRPFPNYVRWAWVARIDSGIVFGHRTIIKKFRYSPGHPDSGGANYYLEEHWLASSFGLVYKWQEPNTITYLRGCIIAGDTFGFVTSVGREEFSGANKFSLNQNYPNPFNPSTLVTVSLPERAILNLRVFDLLGREAAVLADGNYPAGLHHFRWNAVGFSSGVYFCRMQANDRISTIKMLLTK